MPAINTALTKAITDALAANDGKRMTFTDTQTTGLVLRASAGRGKVTGKWAAVHRSRGKRHNISFADYWAMDAKTARLEAAVIISNGRRGEVAPSQRQQAVAARAEEQRAEAEGRTLRQWLYEDVTDADGRVTEQCVNMALWSKLKTPPPRPGSSQTC